MIGIPLVISDFLLFLLKESMVVSSLKNIDPSVLEVISRFKLHFLVLLSAKSSIKELKILSKLTIIGPLSSYKLSQELGMPSATAWRILKKLCKEGYVQKGEKNFSITPKGLAILFKNYHDDKIRKVVAKRIKEIWNYEGSVDEIYCLLKDMVDLIDKGKIDIKNICLNYPASLAGFLYPLASELSEETKKVIAHYMLKTFPSTNLTPYCRGIISFDNRATPYLIAVECKAEGIKLNHYCELLQKLYNKNSIS
ncbi:winged helix-turn-helix transcriptional regulator [Sulfurisphaera tokodaii]|nr:winged helix-turn-helix transcriptional regulator [Sulfurisphaera tokodaii]HII73877.1 winged helix-turn-helix transcriptional regulator [Sulfurisphaera tokodaii]